MVDLVELLIGKEGDKDYKKKPVIVQGITGKFGSFHTQQMLAYGRSVVAGVTPGRGAEKDALTLEEFTHKQDPIVVGPNTPGVNIPGVIKIGNLPAPPPNEARIAQLSRRDTLTYEASHNLPPANFDQSICLGIGGHAIN